MFRRGRGSGRRRQPLSETVETFKQVVGEAGCRSDRERQHQNGLKGREAESGGDSEADRQAAVAGLQEPRESEKEKKK